MGVFIGAGAFTDEDQRRGWIAYAEDQFVAALVEAAAAAISDVGEDLRKRLAGSALLGTAALLAAAASGGAGAARRYSVLIPRSW